jgi:hypothetical protein
MTYFPLLNRRRNNTEYNEDHEDHEDHEDSEINETFILLTLHVNFYYEEIMKDQKILKFLDDSKTLLNKITRENSNMTIQQINSCFIAFNIMIYVSLM